MDEVEKLLNNKEEKYFTIRNGYTQSTTEGLTKLSKKFDDMISDGTMKGVLDAVKIGVVWDAEAPFEMRYRCCKPGSTQILCQTYCSAVSCAYTSIKNHLWEPLARLALDGAYEATLWAGVINKSRNGCGDVYLTKLGGGAFGNDDQWIIDAIANAVHALNGYELNVVVVHYSVVNKEFKEKLGIALGRSDKK